MPRTQNPTLTNLQNPYKDSNFQIPGGSSKIVGDVSLDDLRYLKTKYPFLHGLIDRILSQLFFAFITELRAAEPFLAGVIPGDAGYAVLSRVLQRFTDRQCAGDSSPRPVELRADGVCETVCAAPQQCAEQEGSPVEGGRDEAEESGEVQRGESDGASLPTSEESRRLAELLRNLI